MSGPTLRIEGDLLAAFGTDDGKAMLAEVRRSLVTGGRHLLGVPPWPKPKEQRPPGQRRPGQSSVCTITLTPEIEHRIRTSGAALTEEEIAVGMEQIRESGQDVQALITAEMEAAIDRGMAYSIDCIVGAITNRDERGLHRAWETARKTITVARQLDARTQQSTG